MIGSTMPHAWKEREDLAKADIDIAEGEKRVAEQIALVERLAAHGHDLTEAKKLLQNYEQTLEAFQAHRQIILDEIARQEGPEPQHTPIP